MIRQNKGSKVQADLTGMIIMNYNFHTYIILGNNKDICPQSACKLKRKGSKGAVPGL